MTDPVMTESAAGHIVALCNRLELSREETAATLMAIALNHLVATGVPIVRVHQSVDMFYARTPPDSVLVDR